MTAEHEGLNEDLRSELRRGRRLVDNRPCACGKDEIVVRLDAGAEIILDMRCFRRIAEQQVEHPRRTDPSFALADQNDRACAQRGVAIEKVQQRANEVGCVLRLAQLQLGRRGVGVTGSGPCGA